MQRLQYAAWGPAELKSAVAAIVTGRASAGPAPTRLAERLGALIKAHGAYALNAGRTAIWLALVAMRKLAPARKHVVVPAYICPGVTHAVERAGLEWTVADVGDDLNVEPAAVRNALDDRTLAVIVPHMYGCPARIGEIEGICRAAGVFMIDDAAQVVGVEHDGRVLGSFGDAGILSFAQSKSVVTGVRGSGGMLLVNTPALDHPVREAYEQLSTPRGRVAQFGYFLSNYLTLPHLGPLGRHVSGWMYYLPPLRAGRDFFVPARMSNLDAAIALRQMTHLSARCAAKIRLAGLFARELRGVEGVRFPQYSAGRYLTRFMVAVADDVNIDNLRADLRRAGVESRPGYRALTLSDCNSANAQAWSGRLVELPSRTTMADRDVRVVCRALGEALHGRAAPDGMRQRPGTAA